MEVLTMKMYQRIKMTAYFSNQEELDFVKDINVLEYTEYRNAFIDYAEEVAEDKKIKIVHFSL